MSIGTERVRKQQIAEKQWARYKNALIRGHEEYQKTAKQNEEYYLGGGRQWTNEEKNDLEAVGKPWLEENIIFSTVNTVIGTQTQSRMDIAYKPREPGEQDVSDVLTKIGMFTIDQNKFPWLESQVFADGMIQQRGYFDIRMDFDDNAFGEIKIETLDPLGVIPDQDAKDYDPDKWQDVITTKWMLMDDVKETYGPAKFRAIQRDLEAEPDFGEGGEGVARNKFGQLFTHNAFFIDEAGNEHVRVLERQHWRLQMRSFWFDAETGDFTPIPDKMKPSEAKRIGRQNNAEITKKLSRRVRWTVATSTVVLHDAWSPYDHFTIVPYYPYFRRGVTVGMVDNLVKTQEMLNKTFSQILHIVNTTANSGWTLEEGTLTNMDTEDLEEEGGKTGLVIEHKRGSNPPAKIEPNQIPTGLKDLVNTAIELIRLISGVSEAFSGQQGNEVSGVAIQGRIQQAAVSLASPIDNLFRTRNMIGERILGLIQQFYTDRRSFLITTSENEEDEAITINQDVNNRIVNDVTRGKYDIVIADVPTQITFQNAQFAQALEMRKFGIQIPDDEMVLMSTLSRKQEIVKKITGELNEEQQEQARKTAELQIEELEATVQKLLGEAKNKNTAAAKAATEIAQAMQANPALGPMIDAIMESSNPPLELEPEQPQQIPGVEELPQFSPEDFQG